LGLWCVATSTSKRRAPGASRVATRGRGGPIPRDFDPGDADRAVRPVPEAAGAAIGTVATLGTSSIGAIDPTQCWRHLEAHSATQDRVRLPSCHACVPSSASVHASDRVLCVRPCEGRSHRCSIRIPRAIWLVSHVALQAPRSAWYSAVEELEVLHTQE